MKRIGEEVLAYDWSVSSTVGNMALPAMLCVLVKSGEVAGGEKTHFPMPDGSLSLKSACSWLRNGQVGSRTKGRRRTSWPGRERRQAAEAS